MAQHTRIDKLKSAAEAAGVAMAPAPDQFEGEIFRMVSVDPGNYSRSWVSTVSQTSLKAQVRRDKLKQWFLLHWPRGLSHS